jgi:hypothetical protein
MLIETHYRVHYKLHFFPDEGVVQIDIISTEPIPAVATKMSTTLNPTSAEEEEQKKQHREKRRTLLPFFYW